MNTNSTSQIFASAQQTISDAFNMYFEMIPDSSNSLKEEAYKLRYQVYCIETGFEDAVKFRDRREKDDSDDNAIHSLIRHRKSGLFAATTRLILPREGKKFPIEQHCVIDNQELISTIPRQQLAEVSRFCVSQAFKKRKGEAGTLFGVNENDEDYFSQNERRVFPHITLALIAALIEMSRRNNIEYWFAVMEPSLLRFLKRIGILFTQIGPQIDYHGIRQPGVAKVDDILNGVKDKNMEIWDFLTDQR